MCRRRWEALNFVLSARRIRELHTSPAAHPPHLCQVKECRRLHCLPGCRCCCHRRTTQVVTNWLAPYIGRVDVSQRLLQDIWLSSHSCDVQTCHRDRTSEAAVKWWMPWWMPAVNLRMQFQSSSFPLLISIHAPRVIPDGAEVWGLIWDEDLTGLQELFEARAASIYDVAEDGVTLLFVSGVIALGLLRLIRETACMSSVASKAIGRITEDRPVPCRGRRRPRLPTWESVRAVLNSAA